MKKVLIILVFILVAWRTTLAQQDIYYTPNATLTLNGKLDGKVLKLQTRKLDVELSYETAHIIIRFPIYSLETEEDSLSKLIEKSLSEVIFEGNLGMDYINTKKHAPIKFITEGFLTVGNSKTLVKGTGELDHVGNATTYACILSLVMQLNLADLNAQIPLPGLEDSFRIIITQALLQHAEY